MDQLRSEKFHAKPDVIQVGDLGGDQINSELSKAKQDGVTTKKLRSPKGDLRNAKMSV